MQKEKIKSIARCVLAVLGVAGVLTIAAVAPNSVQMLKMFGLKDKRYKTKSVYSSLKRMQNQRLIEITEKRRSSSNKHYGERQEKIFKL